MELMLGSHVREHGNRVGRLAGFELEPATRCIRRIIFSSDGELGPQAVTRPLHAVGHVHDGGEIELRVDIQTEVLPAVPDVVLLSRATRLKRDGHLRGKLAGVEVNPVDRQLQSVFGRPHWWSKRVTIDAAELNCSIPGEISDGKPTDSRAA
jgi:hypothetical protein